MMRSRRAIGGILLAWWIIAGGGARAAEPVDLALVLAVDVSRSIDDQEFQLQRQGYAAALTDRRVLQAIRSGPLRAIAVTLVEWSNDNEQRVVVDWTVLKDGETAGVIAQAILA